MSFPNASHPASPVPPFEVSLHRLDGAQALACVEALTDVLISSIAWKAEPRRASCDRSPASAPARAYPDSGKWHKNGRHAKSPPQVRREGPVR
ncbi:hypothetical protein PPN31119_04660 [Pandoraea pnomenusa]|uniref:Acyl-CoA carboxylase subunit epsilon n=1 Tax=Pandoraea pnomenusa TaxID=93220 RepID=A0ABY6WQI6_9BURK|nr:hypothetical protein PPN31119_04660 [Pandoraea pnomenusa]